MRRNPVLFAMSILAALQMLAGAGAFTDSVGPKVAGLIIAAVAAAQLGGQFWVKGEVTPVADPRDNQGRLLVPMR